MKGLLVILGMALIWGAGLFAFSQRVIHSTPAPDAPHADGIVALTGASTLRILAAVRLLEEGKANRLLVSGVNPLVTRSEMKDVTHDYTREFDCCVDLGFRAANTQGNAREIASWADYHHYATLIVVTADYHMPRAILELRATVPGRKLYAYPVATSTLDARRWWRSQEDARRMIVEYSKYLVILGRSALVKFGGGKREAAAGNVMGASQPA